MALVVDASVAVKWLIVEENSSDARGLLDDEELRGPRLLVSEVANPVWRKVRPDQVDRGSAAQLVATMPDMPVRRHADETICADAIQLAIVYDLMYLALAQRLGVRVVTADQRLVNALAMTDHCGLVVPLTNRTRDG